LIYDAKKDKQTNRSETVIDYWPKKSWLNVEIDAEHILDTGGRKHWPTATGRVRVHVLVQSSISAGNGGKELNN